MEMKSLTLNGTKYDSFPDLVARQNGGTGGADLTGVVKEITTATFKTGDNILTDAMVTLGAGWSGNLATSFTHTAGSTEPLTFNIGSADGEKYLISAAFNNEAEWAVHLAIGNSYPTDPYGKNPFVWGVQSVDGGSLTITPMDANWAGSLLNLECRKVTEDGIHEVTVPLDNLAHGEMPNHLSGFWDMKLGLDALKNSVNTTRCLAIGANSLLSLKTGGRNIGIGTYAMPYMEYGENNISIGADSAFEVKEAHNCVVIGKAAMSFGGRLENNVAIGWMALYGDSDRSNTGTQSCDNVAIGQQSGFYNCSKCNVFLGSRAGYFNNNWGNVFIGNNAGGESTWKSTGYGLVVIGQQAGVAEGKTTSTVVGSGAKASWSDCVTIGANAHAAHQGSIAIGAGAVTTKNHQAVIGKDTIQETLLKGDLVVRGTDGTLRKITFEADGTCKWEVAA